MKTLDVERKQLEYICNRITRISMIFTCAFASLAQSNLPSLPSAGKTDNDRITEHEIPLFMTEGTQNFQ